MYALLSLCLSGLTRANIEINFNAVPRYSVMDPLLRELRMIFPINYQLCSLHVSVNLWRKILNLVIILFLQQEVC